MSYKYNKIAVAGVGMVAAMVLSGNAQAYTFLSTPDGTPLRWYTTPVPYYVGPLSDDLPEDEQMDAILNSFAAWESVPGVELRFEFMGTTDVDTVANDGVNVVFFQKQGWPSDSAAIANTQSYASGETGGLIGFDLRINEAGYTFTTTDEQSGVQTDLQNAITHEVGHVAGLNHSQDPEATMYAVTSRGDLGKRTLATDDEAGAFFLYGEGEFQPSHEDDAVMGCGCSSTGKSPQEQGQLALSMLALGGLMTLGRRRARG